MFRKFLMFPHISLSPQVKVASTVAHERCFFTEHEWINLIKVFLIASFFRILKEITYKLVKYSSILVLIIHNPVCLKYKVSNQL